jgi:hypothetical protein
MADKNAGKGYKSDLNIHLSQVPKSSNPDIFNDLVELYNAVHTLNAYMSSVVDSLYGNNKEANPAESMKFIRAIWVPAGEAIAIGNCVRYQDGNTGRVQKGHRYSTTGLALTEAIPTVDDPYPLIRVGFGPAMIPMDGINAGDEVFTTDGGDSLADPYRGQLITSGKLKNSCPVGKCMIPGYLLFCPGWYNNL